MIITLPDGTEAELPDGLSAEQINKATSFAMQKARFNPSDPDFLNENAPHEGILKSALIGLGSGLTRAAQGPQQLMGGLLGSPKNEYTQQAQAERDLFDRSPVGQSFTGMFSQDIGETLPYLASGAPEGSLARRAAIGGLTGAGIGASQFVPEGESRGVHTAIGGLTGAVAPAIVPTIKELYGAGKFIKSRVSPSKKQIIKEMAQYAEDPATALKKIQAGKSLGTPLTPAEATGSGTIAQMQGELGKTRETQNMMESWNKSRQSKEAQAISDLYRSLSSSADLASSDIRNAATRAIQKEAERIRKQAKPLYEELGKQKLPKEFVDKYFGKLSSKSTPIKIGKEQLSPDLIEKILGDQTKSDPVISSAYNSVLNKPHWKRELIGHSRDSMKAMDLVRREIRDRAEAASRKGNSSEASVLYKTLNEFTDDLDSYVPEYASIRKQYGDWANPLSKLRDSAIGKLSGLKDEQLKNTSKIIFDPTEIDLKRFMNIRDVISKENPDAWKRIVRNEMERRMDDVQAQAGDKAGQTFFNKIISRPKDYRKFLEATKNIPEANRRLKYMRQAWQDLISANTAKTLAGQARTGMTQSRNPLDAFYNLLSKMSSGQYDKVAIDAITSGEFEKELRNAMRQPTAIKRLKRFLPWIEEYSRRSIERGIPVTTTD